MRYALRKRLIDWRYGQHTASGEFATPGKIMSFQPHDRGLTARCDAGAIRITVIAADCFQVRFSPDPASRFPVPFSYAVAKVSWADVPFAISENEYDISISTAELTCRLNKITAAITITNKREALVSHERIIYRLGEFRLMRTLQLDELVCGLASQPTGIDLRGRRYALWNTDPVGIARDKIPSYFTIPVYLGVHATFAFGMFWDNTSRGWVDIGAEERDRITFSGSSGELRYYVFSGPDVASVLSRYTELTGRMPLPPLWALGFHLSRWSYYPESQVRHIADELRRREIPCDALYLDIHYMDGYRCFTWDRARFPDPGKLVSDLAEQGFKTVAILDPGIKRDPGYEVYDNGLRADMFLKTPGRKVIIAPVWAGDSAFPDFTSAEVRKWWGQQFSRLLDSGIAGVWNDMNEPIAFNFRGANDLPESIRHSFEGIGASHLEMHNVYGMQMARASREALERQRPDRRPFNIVRAGYAGVQRYASAWTGDNVSNWDQLRLSVTMVINAGLSGLAFTGPDVGGFFDNAEPELYTRWMQLGAVMPFFRVHTALNTAPHEPWAFGQPYEDICRRAVELRYRLLPYLYSVFAQSATSGMPILRPMFMLDPQDAAWWKIEDQFMLGDTLLVAPILHKGDTQRDVRLPAGSWYDFWSNERLDGGKSITVDAPLDRLPLFVAAGKVLPLYPVQQYAGAQYPAELKLRVYPGSAESTVYEDAGEGLGYQHGDYRWMYFTTRPLQTGGFKVDWRRAGKYDPGYANLKIEIIGLSESPSAIELNDRAAPVWYYENGMVEMALKKPFDTLRIAAMSGENHVI
jgi:alpha-glucosidase